MSGPCQSSYRHTLTNKIVMPAATNTLNSHTECHANGHVTDAHNESAEDCPMLKAIAGWTHSVPADTHIYGTKTIDCSDEEWKVRVDLAAAYRLCFRLGLCEGINNHLTAAIPGSRDQFLVFPFGLLWSEVTASSLLVVDSEGKVIRGKGQPEATAFYVHARLHKRHPRGMAIMHTHQSYATAICCLEDPSLLMINQNSLRFHNDFVCHAYQGLVLDHNEGDDLATVMQDKRILMHQNHGVIICAETVASCFDLLYYLERAAKLQVLAMSTGKPLAIVPEAVSMQFKKIMDGGVRDEYARLHLEARKREMIAGVDKDFIK